MVMIPPERPTCDLCLDAAVMCECPNLTCSREVLIPLVYRTEPCNRRESLDLFATYLERHLATRSIDIRRFINDYAKELKAVEQVKQLQAKLTIFTGQDVPSWLPS